MLARTVDEKQLIELRMFAGDVHGVVCVQNALQLRLMTGNGGRRIAAELPPTAKLKAP